ncbi:endonuclease III [Bradyrhizobium sp. 2TAF24]|uniref:endonuclease III n=1 Tax=Bradyrhizobium sp. 2TAF24 TaxID=3233011 RepID=UPI003F92F0C7
MAKKTSGRTSKPRAATASSASPSRKRAVSKPPVRSAPARSVSAASQSARSQSARSPSTKSPSAKTTSTKATSARSRSTAAKPWTAAEVTEAFRRFREADPEPKGELEYINPYTLLVAVALSAQATDVGVNKATRNLFPVADTPQKMLALGEERVREAIKTIGLYRNKAKNVIAMSQLLIERHGGEVPRDRAALEALPGVGRKTANVVLNIAFGEPTIAVDTHLFRVGNRTGLAPGKTPLEVELKLERIIPVEFKRHAHHWLILHGRYTCIARKPLCERCVINDLCRWPEKIV